MFTSNIKEDKQTNNCICIIVSISSGLRLICPAPVYLTAKMTSSLPSTHRALVLDSRETGFTLQRDLPTPEAVPGTAVVKIAASGVLSYSKQIYDGQYPYPFPTPLVGGISAVGHIAALGSDAVTLKVGQLVFVVCVIRA
jgi:hypothetical protein